MPPCCIPAEALWSTFTTRAEGRNVGLHCYGTLSARDLATILRLFFLDVGRMPAASRESIQSHMVSL